MRLRGASVLLCAAAGIFAMVSDANGQPPGGVNNSTMGQAMVERAQKEPLAEWIVAREEMQLGREFDPAYRARVKEALESLSLSALEAQERRGGFVTNALGDSSADLVFTPVTPCRIIDTRLAGGTLGRGQTRDFLVAATNYAPQGGSATGCGVPFGSATAVKINFVAVAPVGLGYLSVTPYGTPMPTASIINFTKGVNIANELTAALCDPSVATCTYDITMKAGNKTHIVADVQGYFQKVTRSGVLTLASGQTMKGEWSVGGFPATASGQYIWAAFTFPLTLASAPAAPAANYIPVGGASTASCPGTPGNPLAAAGQLCVYARTCGNTDFSCIFSPAGTGCGTADPFGAGLYFLSAGAGQAYCYGTWAVTAP